jgi:chromosome segregation ATPase
MILNRQQAADAASAAAGERDTVQANLLDLDGSFGKRLLSGAALTGISKQRWDTAAEALGTLWDMFNAYSAVVDRSAELAAGRLGNRELTELSELLTGRSVELARGQAPLARRDLADSGVDKVTLATARARMREKFTQVTDVVSAAEQIWTDMAGRLDAAAQALARADPGGDEGMAAQVTAAKAELDRLRGTLNTDPLGAQLSAADRLGEMCRSLAAKSAEVAQVRANATQRVAAAHAASEAARAAYSDAVTAYQRATEKIADVPAVPAYADPPRLAAVDSLLSTARWARLGSELSLLEQELLSVQEKYREMERTLVSLLSQREELRGLLDAYKAKAARLGRAEDENLATLYQRTRDLLWSAPCDLSAAADAVTIYQRAVLARGA